MEAREKVLALVVFANGGDGTSLRAKCTHHNISLNNVSFLGVSKGGDARN